MFVLCSGHISRREPAQNQIWCFGYGYSECQEKSGWSGRKLDVKQMNTKLLRFRIENLRDVKLSQNAKLTLESFSIPAILDDTNEIKHTGNIILKLKNISDSKCYDSSNNNNSSPILFIGSVQSTAQTYVDINTVSTTLATTLIPAVSTYNNSIQKELMYNGSLNFINPSPDKLFNFTIPNTNARAIGMPLLGIGGNCINNKIFPIPFFPILQTRRRGKLPTCTWTKLGGLNILQSPMLTDAENIF